jgi:hypothetical protein
MKDYLKLTLFLTVAVTTFSVGASHVGKWPTNYPERSISVSRETAVVIDKSSVIAIEPGAPKTLRYAASELQTLLSKILGQKLQIVETLPTTGSAIVLGLGKWSKEAGIAPEKIIRDGYIIKTSSGRVYIAGRDDPKVDIAEAVKRGGAWSFFFERGTLNGVYDFLERFAGARFYFPGSLGTILPETAKINVPQCTIIERPDFIVRKVSTYWDGVYFEGANPDATINPAKNVNLLRLRLESKCIPCSHGLNGFDYLKRFKSKPEYFALLSNGKRGNDPSLKHSGQLCYNSGIREEIYQDVKVVLSGKGIEKRPGLEKGRSWRRRRIYPGYVDIMPQDGFQACQCQKCLASYTDETHYASDLMWGLVVEVANRLKRERISGYVTMMGYRPYRRVPKIDIPDNVLVMVAETGPWEMNDSERHANNNAEIKAWSEKLGHKVWLWNYSNKLSTLTMPGVPSFTPRAIGRYYRKIAPWIFGAFNESESDRFLFMAMNHYIFAKTAWNSTFDGDDAVEEFYVLMFGKGAVEMKKALDRIEKIWTTQIAGRMVETNLGPIGAPPSDDELWNKVYSPKVLTELEKNLADAEELVAPGSLEAKRIQLFRREFIDSLKKAGNEYLEKTNVVKGLHLHVSDSPSKKVMLVPLKAGGKKTVKTEVGAQFTSEALVITFDCEEPEMDTVSAVKRKFDDPEIWRDNGVEVFLNPSGDRKTLYQLIVNSEGCLSDQKLTAIGAKAQGDWKWNSGTKVDIKKHTNGYTLTMTIPLEALPGLNKKSFPANFCRNRVVRGKSNTESLYTWSPYLRRGFHDYENFGTIGTSGKSLIINGDFSFKSKYSKRHWGLWDDKRNWVEGWIGSNKETPTLDETIFVTPPTSIKLVSKASQASVSYWSLKKLVAGKRYKLSYMVRLKDVKPLKRGGGVVVNLWDDANRWFPSSNRLTGTMDWTRQTFEFTAAKNTNQGKRPATLRLRFVNAIGTAWFDDVSIEEITL